jgi:hypothetical protein
MFHWLRKALGSTTQPRKRARTAAPRLERLEERDTPTVWTVTSVSDHGANSLRTLIAAASDGDTINFSVSLPGIQLENPIVIDKDLDITGPGSGNLGINGSGETGWIGPNPEDDLRWFRIFNVADGKTCSISGLTLTNGTALGSNGGGIYNEGNLTLCDIVISTCAANDVGGGIYNADEATLAMTGCYIHNCKASKGGGIANEGGTVTVTNCYIYLNEAITDGGGIASSSGTVSLFDTEVYWNQANTGGGIHTLSTFTMEGGEIYNNSTTTDGAGIFVDGGASVTLTEVDLSGNIANGTGGGFCVDDGSITLDYCDVNDNTAFGNSSTNGGGLRDGFGFITYYGAIMDGYTYY